MAPETTPVQRHTMRMYERREEAWRPLNKQRVAAFIRLFMLCFVEVENGVSLQRDTYRMLKKTLVQKFIPWIYNRLVFTMDEMYWPITLADFRELDGYLVDHLPRIQKEDQWDTVAFFSEKCLGKGRNTNDWKTWRKK